MAEIRCPTGHQEMKINRFFGSFANGNQQTVNVSGKKNWAKIMSSQQNQQDIYRLTIDWAQPQGCWAGVENNIMWHLASSTVPSIKTWPQTFPLSQIPFAKKQKAQNQLVCFYFQHSRLLWYLIRTKDKTCTFHKLSKENKPRGPRPNIALRKKEERPVQVTQKGRHGRNWFVFSKR